MTSTRQAFACSTALAVLILAGSAHAQSTPQAVAADPVDEALNEGAAEAFDPPDEPAPAPELPAAAPTLSDAIAGGKLLLEVRARYENVDQKETAVLTERAQAYTVRTRLGWETGEWYGLKGLIEFEDVRHVGPEWFSVNAPGAVTPPLNGADKAKYPLVNDPDVTELNRLQLAWTPNAAVQATLGRQRILIDDQRFIGNVGWRQDEQTFDALRFDLAQGRFKATYAYVAHVNRILGEMRDWDSDSHLFNATWSLAEAFRLQGFVYALDVARQYILTGAGRKALVVGAEKMSAILDWQDRGTCVIFGDGAGAVVLEAGDGASRGIVSTAMGSDGSLANLIRVEAGGSALPASAETVQNRQHFIKMEGNQVFKSAVRGMAEISEKALALAGIASADLKAVVPHQANVRIISAIAEKLAIPMDKVVLNLDRYGNTTAASIPLALEEAVREGRIQDGDFILLVAFGAGLTWGATVIQWGR